MINLKENNSDEIVAFESNVQPGCRMVIDDIVPIKVRQEKVKVSTKKKQVLLQILKSNESRNGIDAMGSFSLSKMPNELSSLKSYSIIDTTPNYRRSSEYFDGGPSVSEKSPYSLL